MCGERDGLRRSKTQISDGLDEVSLLSQNTQKTITRQSDAKRSDRKLPERFEVLFRQDLAIEPYRVLPSVELGLAIHI